jgi:predicted rRNA methylase
MTLIVCGIHVVGSLINSSRFNFEKIFLLKDLQKKEIFSFLIQKKIPYQLLDKESFSRYTFPKKNQGVVALISDYNYFSLKFLLSQKPQRKFLFFIMLDEIEDPHNFGAILRTAAAFSIDGIIISKRNQVPVNSTVAKVSVGGIAYIPVCRVESLLSALSVLKENNFKIISTICNEDATEYNKLVSNSSICLIFGNEHRGIREKILKKADHSLFIPLSNKKMNSLNVSVSCGIILAHLINN